MTHFRHGLLDGENAVHDRFAVDSPTVDNARLLIEVVRSNLTSQTRSAEAAGLDRGRDGAQQLACANRPI